MSDSNNSPSAGEKHRTAALRDYFIPESVSPFKFVISFNDSKEYLLIGSYDKINRYLRGDSIPDEQNTDIEGLLNDFYDKGIHATAKRITNGFKSRECHYHYNNISVFSVREFPVGTFLLTFEEDKGKQWQHAINQFRYALSGKSDPSEEKSAMAFLINRYKTYDLVCQYVIVSMLRYYFYALTLPRAERADVYERQMFILTRAFWTTPGIPEPGPISRNSNILRLPSPLYPEEQTAQTWFAPSSETECIVLERSFFPLKFYYKNHLNKLGLSLQRCKYCGRYFFVKNMKIELCSDECKKAHRKKADQKYYTNKLNRINKNAHQAWLNRIVKAKNIQAFPVSRFEKLQSEYNKYKDRTEEKRKFLFQQYLTPARLSRYSQEELLSRMATELHQWHEKELEIAKGIMGEFEARSPRQSR